MPHALMKLPFEQSALEPHISTETIEYHYGRHHAGYVKKLNGLIEGTDFEKMSLEETIRSSEGGIFNNAAQVYNHDFYWHSVSPERTVPSAELADRIETDFGSMAAFKEAFMTAAAGLFGSGWTWLVVDREGKLSVLQTGNADTPILHDRVPLLVCDVWEHAYYIDRRNARPEYLEAWWQLINWQFVSDNLARFNQQLLH